MSFSLNNIQYRSTAAKALEHYYNTKAFILNELSDSRNDFSKGARELLLMLLNNYREWTDFTEHYLLDKKTISEKDIQAVISKQRKVALANMRLFESHPEVFPVELLGLWKTIGKGTSDYFYSRVQAAAGMNHLEGFPYLIDCLIGALHSTMYELYEMDCLLGCELLNTRPITTNQSNPNRLVVLIDDNALASFVATGSFTPAERLSVYRKFVKPTSPVLIKNLSSADISYSDSTRLVVGDSLLSRQVQSLVDQYNVIEVLGQKR